MKRRLMGGLILVMSGTSSLVYGSASSDLDESPQSGRTRRITYTLQELMNIKDSPLSKKPLLTLEFREFCQKINEEKKCQNEDKNEQDKD